MRFVKATFISLEVMQAVTLCLRKLCVPHSSLFVSNESSLPLKKELKCRKWGISFTHWKYSALEEHQPQDGGGGHINIKHGSAVVQLMYIYQHHPPPPPLSLHPRMDFFIPRREYMTFWVEFRFLAASSQPYSNSAYALLSNSQKASKVFLSFQSCPRTSYKAEPQRKYAVYTGRGEEKKKRQLQYARRKKPRERCGLRNEAQEKG